MLLPISDGLVLTSFAPLLVALLSPILIREVPSRWADCNERCVSTEGDAALFCLSAACWWRLSLILIRERPYNDAWCVDVCNWRRCRMVLVASPPAGTILVKYY